MNKYLFLIFLPLLSTLAQDNIEGRIVYKEGTETSALYGANVYWLDTSYGVITDEKGKFSIKPSLDSNKLVISYIGFRNDTLLVRERNKFIVHFLTIDNSNSLDEVTVEKRKTISRLSFQAQNVINVNNAELLKAACCNLSESFETNPSIDVNFADALTGTKQIKMLGLKSPYILITEENIPSVRGASQFYGLTYTPGTWIESIQISKGSGSVTNGFESITGQINTELKKPFSDFPFFLNLFSSANGRLEFNSHLNKKISDKFFYGVYIHGNKRDKKTDSNNDNFLDLPISEQINVLNRLQFVDNEKGIISFLSFRFLKDEKLMGSKFYDPKISNKFLIWGSEVNTERLDTSLKLGYVSPELPYQSLGLQVSYNFHDQMGSYGYRVYNINHESFFTNFVYNSIIGNTKHKFKTGINFSSDNYNEDIDNFYYNRIDSSIGGFFEYNYNNLDNLNFNAGLRVDNHNRMGFFITPRFHLSYSVFKETSLRFSIGTGRKVSNIFAENQSLFGSNRQIEIKNNGGSIYGLRPEKALNYGFGINHKLLLFERPFNIFIERYVTKFDDQVIVDWEESRKISFYNLEGESQSKNFQIEIDYSPSNLINLRFAYKDYDVKADYINGYLRVPMIAKTRFFSNVSFESERNTKGAQWRYDFTHHFIGKQRYFSNQEISSSNFSPNYSLINSQLTRAINYNLELYLGSENIGNYTQKTPIVDSENPFGPDFDTSQIYAPIFGRMIYLGLRWNL